MGDVRKGGDDRTRVLVIGGGIIGLAVAARLARDRLAVTVLERGRPGWGATRAAAGMLSPLGEAADEGPFLELGLRSLARYGGWVEEVEAGSGIDLEYRTPGKLLVALDEESERALAQKAEFARRHDAQARRVEAEELHMLEPGLSPHARGGLLIPFDHRVENRRLGEALHRYARAAGVAVRTHAGARRLLRDRDRASGVELEDGRRLGADAVVVAAGCWSGALEGLPRPLPVEPVRGQMVLLGPTAGPPRRTIDSGGIYLVGRDDGSILAGSTEERAGFDARPTAAGVKGLLESAVTLWPALARAPVTSTWAGLRPGTPDRKPVIGPDPELAGLHYATGHFRNGILLAPETAEIVATAIAGRPVEVELRPFRPCRFS